MREEMGNDPHDGRVPLETHVVESDAAGPHLLITAGVHGDEFEPMVAVRRLIAAWPRAATRGKVTLVPVVNAAALERGQRTAEDGLDLARVCPGSTSGSITERTAASLTALIQSADYYVDLHTGGVLYDIWPLAGYVLHADERILERQRAMAEAFDLPVVWGTSARLPGRSLSVARDAGVPAIYAEHGGGCGCRKAAVDDYVEGCLRVAALVGVIEHEAAGSRVRFRVEDDREGSGHLQIQQPSPAAGFFEPCVALGDVVERGETLGHVVDATGSQRLAAVAEQSGRVLLLRSFPRVAREDTLAVILPICEPGSVRLENE